MPAVPASRTWRKFLRCSVRGLIVLVLVIAIGLGWIVRGARIQRQAVAAIEKAGGRASYDWEWNNETSIPRGKPWAPSWLTDLIGVDYFGHVTHVWLIPSEADDATIAQVGRLTRLQQLVHDQSSFDCIFSSSTLSDAGLARLKALTSLVSLHLTDTQITDAGLVHLEGLTKLSYLNLRGARITGTGLAHLKGLNKLSSLDLDGNQVTDAGLPHLKALGSLSALWLNRTQVTDAGLVHLKGLTKLSELGLDSTQVTDAGLVHLKGLTKLSELGLMNTRVTDAGIKELEQALPGLKIYR
jgi:internalin A